MAKEFSMAFDSVNGDRQVYSAEWAMPYKMMWSNGISPEPNSLKVTAAGNMQVAVGYGGANLEGRFYWLLDDGTGILKLSIPPADPTYDRIDRIVLRLDLSAAERRIWVKVLQGTALAEPMPPALTRDANAWELSLAQIRVRGGIGATTDEDITDEREMDDICGRIQLVGANYLSLTDWRAFTNEWENHLSNYNQHLEAYAAHAHTGEDGTVKVDAGNISNLADYIVEQGVSGIWTYRKWASGIIECWGQTDIGAVGITNTTGGQYYSNTQYLDYPPLANQVDHVSLSAYSDVTVYTLSEYWLANRKIAYRLMTGYQVTTPLATRLSAYVMGRWQQNA